jgi:MFS family permease
VTSEAVPEGSGPAEEAYTSREKRLIIAAACLGWGLEFFDLMLVSFLAPQMIEEFGVSTGVFGAVFTTQLVATAVGGVLFGWLADVYGRRRVLTWTILVFSISTALVAFAPSLAWLFVLRFITGLGTGGEWAVGFSLLNEAWSPRRRGLAGGIVQASLWPGFALGIFVSTVAPGWRWAFAIGLLPALAALWVRYYCPESKQWLEYQRLKEQDQLPQELQEKGERTELWQIFGGDVLKLTVLGTVVVFGAQYSYYVTRPGCRRSSRKPSGTLPARLRTSSMRAPPSHSSRTLQLGISGTSWAGERRYSPSPPCSSWRSPYSRSSTPVVRRRARS